MDTGPMARRKTKAAGDLIKDHVLQHPGTNTEIYMRKQCLEQCSASDNTPAHDTPTQKDRSSYKAQPNSTTNRLDWYTPGLHPSALELSSFLSFQPRLSNERLWRALETHVWQDTPSSVRPRAYAGRHGGVIEHTSDGKWRPRRCQHDTTNMALPGVMLLPGVAVSKNSAGPPYADEHKAWHRCGVPGW